MPVRVGSSEGLALSELADADLHVWFEFVVEHSNNAPCSACLKLPFFNPRGNHRLLGIFALVESENKLGGRAGQHGKQLKATALSI